MLLSHFRSLEKYKTLRPMITSLCEYGCDVAIPYVKYDVDAKSFIVSLPDCTGVVEFININDLEDSYTLKVLEYAINDYGSRYINRNIDTHSVLYGSSSVYIGKMREFLSNVSDYNRLRFTDVHDFIEYSNHNIGINYTTINVDNDHCKFVTFSRGVL